MADFEDLNKNLVLINNKLNELDNSNVENSKKIKEIEGEMKELKGTLVERKDNFQYSIDSLSKKIDYQSEKLSGILSILNFAKRSVLFFILFLIPAILGLIIKIQAITHLFK